MSSYGKMIAKFRKEKGMTQVQLSELLFVSAQGISKWENDLSEPDLKTMQRLSEIFDKPVSVFCKCQCESEPLYWYESEPLFNYLAIPLFL